VEDGMGVKKGLSGMTAPFYALKLEEEKSFPHANG